MKGRKKIRRRGFCFYEEEIGIGIGMNQLELEWFWFVLENCLELKNEFWKSQ